MPIASSPSAKEAVRRAGLHAGDVRSATVSITHSRLAQAARSLQASDLPTAEIILRARLLDEPTDVHALRMMADLGFRLGLEGEPLLHYALELEPAFTAATLDVAKQRYLHNRYEESLVLINEVLARDPANESTLYMKGVVLGHAGRFEEAIEIYQTLVERLPERARLWASYGRSLKTVGRSEEGIAAFRRAAAIDPSLGEAWWSLSDLKTVRFDDADIATMEAGLRQEKSRGRTAIISTSRSARHMKPGATTPRAFIITPRATAFTARSSIPIPIASPIM